MIETVHHNGAILAIIVSDSYAGSGISFFTPPHFSQQLAHMCHPAGKTIEPHVHNAIQREVFYTQEVLFIKRGRIRVDFYGDDRCYLESRVLGAGDVILLASGGHGFEVLEDLEMIEVKQGPYAGDADKTRFAEVSVHELLVKP